jgi:anaerobic selenocysteine-containing dehydrogenase
VSDRRLDPHRPPSARAAAPDETFYPGPSGIHLASFPPKERWDDWVELDAKAWPRRVERHYLLVPTTCFNCESACGLLAYVDRSDPQRLAIRKLEGNPEHPGSRGRNCAKGPATLNQITDPERILHPLRRAGERGEGRWERVSWEEALADIAARIRAAIVAGRPNEVMYHVGRPGEDGFTERILAAWGVDGHNSHTNICSSSARAGYQLWCGMDRPSPDHANAAVVLLVSAHLETGHYFNPHAQRIVEAKARGAKLVVFDTRLSNTATHADHWLAPVPGSEAAILLAIAHHLISSRRYDRDFVREWWNWKEYLEAEHPDLPATFETFEAVLSTLYAAFTFEAAAAESGVDAAQIRRVAELVAGAGTRLASHTWRSATAGNLGGWQVARCLFLLNALLGAVATPGGTFPNAWNKFVPRPPYLPPHPPRWNELTWPQEFPLAMNELSFLLPHFLKEGRGRLEVYFTRVYNPVWTNPDGLTWIEVLGDPEKIGLHVALTPTWNETAYFADLVLPMGHATERHDLHSYETHDAQWLGFRQPVLRVARERLGISSDGDARVGAPLSPPAGGRGDRSARQGRDPEVWEENELWLDLTWRIDPDGSLGIRRWAESPYRAGERMTVDEYYRWIFENSVPGLPERAAAEGLDPLAYMRRHGAFEVARGVGARHDEEVPAAELAEVSVDRLGRVYSRSPRPPATNLAPTGAPDDDEAGRRPVGVVVGGRVKRGFPTPSGRLEFWSSTLAAWGWREAAVPWHLPSHVHPQRLGPNELVLISTFRLPVHIHTRSANAKWLDELAHTNPVWVHTSDAARLGLATGDLARVETEIGHFVARAWVTEGIRPGVVACSHHMGRWRIAGHEEGQRQLMASVRLERRPALPAGGGSTGFHWRLRRTSGVVPFRSSDPDTSRLWWTDAGVHQNLTFPVHPDPVSGMHCWHQAVRLRRAEEGDELGDVVVDTAKSHEVYLRWMAATRAAVDHSPDGTRRPYWLMRPLKPGKDAFRLPAPPRR